MYFNSQKHFLRAPLMIKILSELLYWIILLLPIISPFISAKISGGKIIWAGYLIGVTVAIISIYLLDYLGEFNGEIKAVKGFIYIIFLVPSSIIFGSFCAFSASKLIAQTKDQS